MMRQVRDMMAPGTVPFVRSFGTFLYRSKSSERCGHDNHEHSPDDVLSDEVLLSTPSIDMMMIHLLSPLLVMLWWGASSPLEQPSE